jgi:hypothetical protein
MNTRFTAKSTARTVAPISFRSLLRQTGHCGIQTLSMGPVKTQATYHSMQDGSRDLPSATVLPTSLISTAFSSWWLHCFHSDPYYSNRCTLTAFLCLCPIMASLLEETIVSSDNQEATISASDSNMEQLHKQRLIRLRTYVAGDAIKCFSLVRA